MAENPLKILIVDDENDIISILSMGFEKLGCQVISANSATDGILKYKEQKPELVLSDIRMPGKASGFDLLKAVKTLNPNQPVALMTGFSDIPPSEMYHEGAFAVFPKPFDRNQIVETMLKSLKPLADRLADKAPLGSAKLEKTFPGLSQAAEAHQFNLGSGGFFVANFIEAEKGKLVSFKINFQGGSPSALEGVGQVKWVRKAGTENLKPGSGIEFLFLTDGCKVAVSDFIKNAQPKSFIPTN